MLNRLQDVFRSFQQHDLRYVVSGGIASVLHGVPRIALDLGTLIEVTPENAQRLLDAQLEAGLGTTSLTTVADSLGLKDKSGLGRKGLLQELGGKRNHEAGAFR